MEVDADFHKFDFNFFLRGIPWTSCVIKPGKDFVMTEKTKMCNNQENYLGYPEDKSNPENLMLAQQLFTVR